MKFPPEFLDEIKARLPASQVIGQRVKLKKAGPGMARAFAVQRGKDALVLCQRPEAVLPRLLLGQERRHFHLPDRDGGPVVPRGGRKARQRGGRRHAAPGRRNRKRATAPAPACMRCWRSPRRLVRAQSQRADRRPRARLSRRPADRRARAARLRARLRGRRKNSRLRDALAAKGVEREQMIDGGAAHPRRGHRRALRPLPEPGDVPDPRSRAARSSPSAGGRWSRAPRRNT